MAEQAVSQIAVDGDGAVALRRADAPFGEKALVGEAFESRIVIEQAKGAMSARFGLTPHEAFHLLHGLAQSQRRELAEFAAEVLRNRGRLDGDIAGDSGHPL
jgi:hypothetical protein